MALPLQLCQSWITFQELLKVAFIGKPGKLRIDSGQYVIMQARGGRVLTETIWKNVVKRNDHLLMAMVLNESYTAPKGYCPFPSCRASVGNAEIKSGGQICPRCFRWARLTDLDIYGKPTGLSSTSDEPNQEEENEDIEIYQQIQVASQGVTREKMLMFAEVILQTRKIRRIFHHQFMNSMRTQPVLTTYSLRLRSLRRFSKCHGGL